MLYPWPWLLSHDCTRADARPLYENRGYYRISKKKSTLHEAIVSMVLRGETRESVQAQVTSREEFDKFLRAIAQANEEPKPPKDLPGSPKLSRAATTSGATYISMPSVPPPRSGKGKDKAGPSKQPPSLRDEQGRGVPEPTKYTKPTKPTTRPPEPTKLASSSREPVEVVTDDEVPQSPSKRKQSEARREYLST